MKVSKRLIFFMIICSHFIFLQLVTAKEGIDYNPYGINAWFWNIGKICYFKQANMIRFRIMVPWRCLEPERDIYVWNGVKGSDRSSDFEFHIMNIKAANRDAKHKIKISLVIYDSPLWARKDPQKVLSYSPEDYADFVIAVLKYCESVAPGLVEAVEVINEEATGEWIDNREPTKGTEQRDPSWYYADILKTTSKAIKSFNPNILVVMDAIWGGAYHHLDELYQLGLKGYFDRLNFHYYTGLDMGKGYTDFAPNSISIQHFPTILGYIKYLAKINDDPDIPVWLTEFGWRLDEKTKARYMEYVIDNCRKSGYVERINYYEGASAEDNPGTKNYKPPDPIALIYCKTLSGPPEEYGGIPISYIPQKGYYVFKKYTEKYPVWNEKVIEKISYIPAATKDAEIINSDFELGKKDGWTGNFEIDSSIKHDGNYSMKIVTSTTVYSNVFKIEPEKLYEVILWIKVQGESNDSIICLSQAELLSYYDDKTQNIGFIMAEPSNCWGIVDTRKYPNGWRRFRFPIIGTKESNYCRLKFEVKGQGQVNIDSIKMISLDLGSLLNH